MIRIRNEDVSRKSSMFVVTYRNNNLSTNFHHFLKYNDLIDTLFHNLLNNYQYALLY